MTLNLSKKEEDVLIGLGLSVKDDYSDDELVEIEEKVGDQVSLHFDEEGNPDAQAIIMEGILDKISELD